LIPRRMPLRVRCGRCHYLRKDVLVLRVRKLRSSEFRGCEPLDPEMLAWAAVLYEPVPRGDDPDGQIGKPYPRLIVVESGEWWPHRLWYRDPEFLSDLPDERPRLRFPRFDVAAWQIPEVGIPAPLWSTLGEENLAAVDQRRCDQPLERDAPVGFAQETMPRADGKAAKIVCRLIGLNGTESRILQSSKRSEM
jgi:hypothetical protein